ncbi:MAG: hypothetical protein NVS3B20_02480 [Polyangiales bacterium]
MSGAPEQTASVEPSTLRSASFAATGRSGNAHALAIVLWCALAFAFAFAFALRGTFGGSHATRVAQATNLKSALIELRVSMIASTPHRRSELLAPQ